MQLLVLTQVQKVLIFSLRFNSIFGDFMELKQSAANLLFKTAILSSTILLTSCGGGGGTSSPDGGEQNNDTPTDTTPPTITLTGDSVIELDQGTAYNDAGATASDDVDGVITVFTTGSVNINQVGQYVITYSATDQAGNQTDTARIINVNPVVVKRLLNDTGIMFGGNYPYGNNLDCTGETISQQDCSFGRDKQAENGTLDKTGAGDAGFDFTKLDNDGNPLDASATSWSCVKDNHTGLIWEVKTDTPKGTDLHSKNDSFGWYSTDSNTNGGIGGHSHHEYDTCTGYDANDSSTYCNSEKYTARVNEQKLCGLSNWKLPSTHELRSIVYYGSDNGILIDLNYFPNSLADKYITDTPRLNFSNSWRIHFGNGRDFTTNNYTYIESIRLVHTE